MLRNILFMEADEVPWVLNPNIDSGLDRVETIMDFCVKKSSNFSSISSDPLFSSIVTLYALILLYFPCQFLRIVLSPVLIITGILLLTLLRFGAIQRYQDETQKEEGRSTSCRAEPAKELASSESNESLENNDDNETERSPGLPDEDHNWVSTQSETDSEPEMGYDPHPCFEESFVQWDVKAPLEVIYEAYEGDDDDDHNEKGLRPNEMEGIRVVGLERYPSLSLYYPESDSDSSSECDFPATGAWDTPHNTCFKWEEEDREGLIEIALDTNGNKRNIDMDFHAEEENLIEIDISPQETMNPPARIVIFRQG